MSNQLRIEWHDEPISIPDPMKALVVKKPHEVVTKIVNAPPGLILQQSPMSVEDFWTWFQLVLKQYLNQELQSIQAQSFRLEEELKVQFSYLQ